MRTLAVIFVAMTVAGCSTPPIPMLDPATGASADCGSHHEFWLLNASFLPGEEMACQRSYEARGWVRAPLRF